VLITINKTKEWLDNYKYWNTKRYCFKCKKVVKFFRCDNCNTFFCAEHSEIAGKEIGEFGSVLDPGGYPLHKKCL